MSQLVAAAAAAVAATAATATMAAAAVAATSLDAVRVTCPFTSAAPMELRIYNTLHYHYQLLLLLQKYQIFRNRKFRKNSSLLRFQRLVCSLERQFQRK
jgi:hypothetical protein